MARIVFLGTGGALNADRYQASILVDTGDTRVLLDTGGGLGLVRRLRDAGVDPASIGHVFLSHRHLDHVGGLEPFILTVSLGALRQEKSPPPLRIYASASTARAVNATLDAADAAGRGRYGDRLTWVTPGFGGPEKLAKDASISLVAVEHLPRDGGAAGCVLDIGGLRIAYSGDTLPSPALADAARGVDLLIHEAGGLDAQAKNVHLPCHSTAADAGRIAAKARARAMAIFHLPANDLVDHEAVLAEARRFAPDTEVFLADDGAVHNI